MFHVDPHNTLENVHTKLGPTLFIISSLTSLIMVKTIHNLNSNMCRARIFGGTNIFGRQRTETRDITGWEPLLYFNLFHQCLNLESYTIRNFGFNCVTSISGKIAQEYLFKEQD